MRHNNNKLSNSMKYADGGKSNHLKMGLACDGGVCPSPPTAVGGTQIGWTDPTHQICITKIFITQGQMDVLTLNNHGVMVVAL